MNGFIEATLEKLHGKLLDLMLRNRLLNCKDSARTLRIIDELPDVVFRILVIDGKEMELLFVISENVA